VIDELHRLVAGVSLQDTGCLNPDSVMLLAAQTSCHALNWLRACDDAV
jgi:hypothetical protein